MLLLEWCSYDGVNIIAGWLGTEQQAASVIMNNIAILLYVNSVGLTYAATSCVGNSLGKNAPKNARKYAHATIIFGTS